MFTVPLPKAQLQKQTLFTSNETAGNVYRIPALLYERESKTLFAFTEQRKTSDDASGEKLVMRTGKIKEGSSKKTVEVIVIINHFGSKLLVNYAPVLNCSVLFTPEQSLF